MIIKSISLNCGGIREIEGRLIRKVNEKFYIDEMEIEGLNSINLISIYNDKINYSSNSAFFEIEKGSSIPSVLVRSNGVDNISRLTDKLFLCHVRLSRKELKYFIIDENNRILWEEVGDKFIQPLSGKLFVTNRLTLDEFWVNDINGSNVFYYKLPEGYNITSEVQVVSDIVYFSCNKEGNNFKKAIGIHLKTGVISWEYSFEVPYNKNLIALTLNKTNNLCYGLSSRFYQVFDPVKGEFLLEKSASGLLPGGISPDLNRQSVHNGKLWFVCDRGPNVSFGAFDINRCELEFIQNYPLEGDDQFDVPVYHEGKLYLRTLQGNTLHIFEKE